MAKNDYWKKRFEILEDKMNNKATPEVLKVQQKLKQANKEIDIEILKWYQRFADNNQISMKDAKKMLSAKQLAEFKWDVNEYIKYGQDNEMFNGLWMKELENASARFHISRLEALKIQTQQSIEKAFADYNSIATNLFGDVYKSDYYMTAFEIQKGFNIGFDVGAINDKQLEMIISKPWTVDKKTFSKRIWDSRAKLVNDVHMHLTRNVLLGKPPDDAINAIAKSFNTTKNQAGRLIMTESAYFASAAQKDCFNMLDVEQFEIVATLDSHTSEICQELDGKVFDMKDYEAGITAPPFHVWCRTTTVPYFADNYTERAARGADGKTEYVPGNMTYKDWKTKYVDDPALATEYFKLKYDLDNYEFKEYENIWKDPVTVKDYSSKQSGIQGKKDYFNNKISSTTDPDEKDKFQKLLDDVIAFEDEGQLYAAMSKRFKEIDKDYSQKAKSAIMNGTIAGANPIVDDTYDPARKDAAHWAKDTKDADSILRDKCGEVWRSSTQREKEAIYRYTQNSGGFNRPLAGFEKPWSQSGSGWERKYYKGVNKVWIDYEQFGDQIRAMTDMISKSTYDADMWLQRGVDYNAFEVFLDLPEHSLSGMTEQELQQFLGLTGRFGNFASCGVSKGKGFSHKDVIMNIYVPKGSEVMYAEPFSAFSAGYDKLNWDGVNLQSSFGHEAEAIIQRGGSYTITKIEKSRGKIWIDVEHHPEDGYDLFQQDPNDWTGSTKNKNNP